MRKYIPTISACVLVVLGAAFVVSARISNVPASGQASDSDLTTLSSPTNSTTVTVAGSAYVFVANATSAVAQSNATGGVQYLQTLPSAVFANPSASLGLTAVNGSALTPMRSDAAPALSQSIAPTWTGLHIFSATTTFNSQITVNSSTASRCARFNASNNLVSATGDCASGDTTGGGGGAPLTVCEFSNANATAPTVNGVSFDTSSGSNVIYRNMAFDTATQESVQFNCTIPASIGTISTATLDVMWTSTSTVATQTVELSYSYSSYGTSTFQSWEATSSIALTYTATSSEWIVDGSTNLNNALFLAGDSFFLNVARNVASDTLATDARLLRLKLQVY